jgi:ABC-type amino acid transport substrate-binding protein
VGIKQRGVLRHLGIPYANFITGSGDGLDVDLVRLFAAHLGVRYQYVTTSWETWAPDLTGNQVEVDGDEIRTTGTAEIKGDLIACGLTILPWRKKLVDFSNPTFPTQVWLLTRGDSRVHPIQPSQDINRDIGVVKALFKEGLIKQVMGKKATCLDPDLYSLQQTGVGCKLANLNLNELAPALINGEAESILLDVPDALIALEKWTGQVKVIGPISEPQYMSVGFPKDAPELRKAFDDFFAQCQRDGTYLKLVKKYYPRAHIYFPDFFKEVSSE